MCLVRRIMMSLRINRKGLCDKQLACTTCSVHILNKYDKIKAPSEEEMDILFLLPEYNYK